MLVMFSYCEFNFQSRLIAHEVQLVNVPLDSTHCLQVVLGVTICLKESCVIILSVLQPGGYILGS